MIRVLLHLLCGWGRGWTTHSLPSCRFRTCATVANALARTEIPAPHSPCMTTAAFNFGRRQRLWPREANLDHKSRIQSRHLLLDAPLYIFT